MSMLREALNGADIYRASFGDNIHKMDRAASLVFLAVFAALIPHGILALFYNETIIGILGERTRKDYVFLLKNNPGFAKAYIGGITLQFIWTVLFTILAIVPVFTHPLHFGLASRLKL